MSKIKVSCVSFLNSQPFVYGLQKFTELNKLIDLSLDVPAICADKLMHNEVDIGLVPVATLANMDDYEIISNYCIGANKIVLSVLLLSNYPIKQIQHILLDDHSRTSNNLTKILAKHYWKTSPQFSFSMPEDSAYFAKVSIGDKAINERGKFKFAFDLAEEWYNFKQKKFVFACWVANKKLPEDFIQLFNKGLQFGIENIEQMINENFAYKIDNLDLKDYLENNINYNFDKEKQESLKMYLTLMKSI